MVENLSCPVCGGHDRHTIPEQNGTCLFVWPPFVTQYGEVCLTCAGPLNVHEARMATPMAQPVHLLNLTSHPLIMFVLEVVSKPAVDEKEAAAAVMLLIVDEGLLDDMVYVGLVGTGWHELRAYVGGACVEVTVSLVEAAWGEVRAYVSGAAWGEVKVSLVEAAWDEMRTYVGGAA